MNEAQGVSEKEKLLLILSDLSVTKSDVVEYS